MAAVTKSTRLSDNVTIPEGLCFSLFSSAPLEVATMVAVVTTPSVITAVLMTLLIDRFCRRRSVLDMFLSIIIPI